MQPSKFARRIRDAMAARPEATAIDFEGAGISWRRFAAATAAVEDLLDKAGAPPAGRIGLVARNRPAHFAALIGIVLANRCTSMVNAFQSPESLAGDIAANHWPVMLAEAQDWSAQAVAAAEAAGTAGYAFGGRDGAELTLVTRNASPEGAAAAPPGGDTAIELLSSGTTGKPKRIRLSRGAVDEMIERTIFQYEMGGSGGDQVQIIPWPLTSLGGTNAALPAVALGQTMVVLERFDAPLMLELIRKYRPPFLSLPPAGLARMLQLDPPKEDLASIKLYFSGSAPLDPQVRRRMTDEYGVPVAEAYGATEFAGIICSWVPEDLPLLREKAGSVGRALPGIQLRVVSPETGEPLPPREVGLVEALVPRVGDAWVRTTDLAWLDEDGFLFLEGRADDAIIRSGFKIVPEDVAEVLRQHPGVGDAAVVGIPDERSGMAPAAAVEPRDPANPPSVGELDAWLRSRLPSYKLPVRYAVVPELPRTGTMKPRREGLRALFEGAEPPAG